MSWSKKLTKKSRNSPKHPTSLGTPSHIGPIPPIASAELEREVGSEGANDEGGSRIVLQDRGHQRSHESGASISNHDHKILEQGRERDTLSTPSEQLSRNAPGLSSTQRESEELNRRERDDQGTVSERQTEMPLVERKGEDGSTGSTAIHGDETVKPGFGSLKAALSVVCANYKEIVATRNKAQDVLSRIDALEECFDSRPNDRAELNRRIDVIRKFEDIEGKLGSFSGEPESQRPPDTAQDLGRFSGLLEDLREIIFDYQMVQQTAAYEQGCNLINPAEATALNSFHGARGAEYRHGDRKPCLKGTRGVVLDEIELWTRDFSQSPVYWLNGLAGTGKSTIAQTVAERAFADGRLGASIFCSRDFEDRSNLRLIFPTLAIQLARKYTKFRSIFVPLVQSDPDIAHESLYNQMDKLIVRPLIESAVSTVIVIDALDECKDEEATSAILSVLGRLISKLPKVKFFFTGRPEPRIQTGFRLPLLKQVTDVFVLHDVKQNLIINDIRLFLKHSFLEIANRRGGLDDWPTDEEVQHLCERAAGLFVYAVATVKFIDKRGTNPRKQLGLLLQSPESSVREAKTKFKANASLDSLYTSILREAFGDENDSDNDPKIRSVVGAVLLATNPLSPSAIATLLDFDVDDVFPLLLSAQSLLIIQDINCPARPFHKSFPDFIVDPDRCTDQRFLVSPPYHHSQLLISCLDLMSRTLEKNMCKLPDGVANSDVNDLKERTERYINPALRYACRSWHSHLVGGQAASVNRFEITSALHRFLESKFLVWLEVLSALGAVRIAVDALQAAMEWLEESPALHLVNDYCHFVTRHFEIISTSSPHICHSALALAPRKSIVHKLYKPHAQPFVKVVHGIPALWDSDTAATTSRFDIKLVVWSPCNGLIAISPDRTMTVDILDSATLQRLQSLEFSREISPTLEALAFSPDSRMLTSFTCNNHYPDSGGFVVTWDLQTGGVVSAIEWKRSRSTKTGNAEITYSTGGKMVAIFSRYEPSTIISIYDIVSGVYMYEVGYRARMNLEFNFGTPYVYKIWNHGESLRFATPEPTRITIWEVELAPGATPTEVESVSIPDNTIQTHVFDPRNQADIAWTKFHPPSCRLAFLRIGTSGELLVWDARASKFLLHHTDIDFYTSMDFSPDGRFFACTTVESEVYLWRESPTGYTFFQKFIPSIRYPTPRFSPNGESLITFCYSTIQLWHTHTTPSGVPTGAPQHTREEFVLEFLPDRPLALVTRKKDKSVTVLDLKSGVPQLTIDTSIEVYGLKSIEDTIVAIGDEKAIIWNLPGANLPPDARVNIKDSVRTINFGNVDHSTMVAASISLDSRYIALIRYNLAGYRHNFLDVYCTSTGQNFRLQARVFALWFASDGHDIWCVADDGVKVYTITQDALVQTKTVADIEYGLWGLPWGSSCGYKVTNEGWVLRRDGKRLLMLPPLWQPQSEVDRVWNGKFLVLLHDRLPEAVILNLEL